jgi:transcriptional regulator of NAD metabolism
MQASDKKITYFQGGVDGLHLHIGLQWVRFLKDMPERNIKESQISKAHIQKQIKLGGIQVYPIYGEPEYFFSVKNEEELLEILEPLTPEEAEAHHQR